VSRELAGSTAIVTGTCGGIGMASVRRFLDEGCTVHGIDRDGDAGRAAESAFRSAGLPFTFHAADLTRSTDLDAAVAACLRAAPRIDILFNNAAVSVVRPIEETDDDTLDAVLATNLRAVYRLCRSIVPVMKAAGGGVILNTASELAVVGQPGYSAYCASKGGVLAFTRALALEVAPHGIRVNALCPGPTDTPMLRAEFATFPDPPAERRATEQSIPLGRLGRADEIAEVALFLVSPRASFVHGAAFLADGGKTAL
jgi:NAD(P)-dependent dehydrogenase (short-subunit alcohol dehydrogenase family)